MCAPASLMPPRTKKRGFSAVIPERKIVSIVQLRIIKAYSSLASPLSSVARDIIYYPFAHRPRNRSNEPTKYICICARSQSHRVFN